MKEVSVSLPRIKLEKRPFQHFAYDNERTQIKQPKYPAGWNERKVRRLVKHYDSQTEDEAIAEDEAAYELKNQAVMVVPRNSVRKSPGL